MAPTGLVFPHVAEKGKPSRKTTSTIHKSLKRLWAKFAVAENNLDIPPASALSSSYFRHVFVSAVHSNADREENALQMWTTHPVQTTADQSSTPHRRPAGGRLWTTPAVESPTAYRRRPSTRTKSLTYLLDERVSVHLEQCPLKLVQTNTVMQLLTLAAVYLVIISCCILNKIFVEETTQRTKDGQVSED